MASQRVENKKAQIKAHFQKHQGAYAFVGTLGLGALLIFKGQSMAPKKSKKEPMPYAGEGTSCIVLEDVNGNNLWRDMDNPDNYYRLEGVA